MRRQSARMSLSDQLFLNPFEKWRRHGKFPWKFFIHCLLAILTALQVVVFITQETGHAKMTLRHFYTIFLGEDVTGAFGSRTFTISNEKDFKDTLYSTIEHYFHINSQSMSIDKYAYPNEHPTAIVEVTWRDGVTNEFPLDAKFRKDHKYMDIIDRVQDLYEVRIRLVVLELFKGPLWTSCFEWHLSPTFNYQMTGQIEVLLGWNIYECSAADMRHPAPYHKLNIRGKLKFPYSFLHAVVAVLAALSFILAWKAIRDSVLVLRKIRQSTRSPAPPSTYQITPLRHVSRPEEADDLGPPGQDAEEASRGGLHHDSTEDRPPPPNRLQRTGANAMIGGSFADGRVEELLCRSMSVRSMDTAYFLDQHDVITWEHLTWREKLSFFNLWFCITIVGNLIQFIATITCFLPGGSVTGRLVCLGVACFFAWLNLLRYLEYFSTYYLLIRTLQMGVPRVGEFLVGVVPVFFGFAVMGVCLFWPTDNFSTLTQASMSLFAVLNGDMIHDTFANLGDISPIFSQIYLYSFLCLFIYVVLNVFISIIEDSFFSEKIRDMELSAAPGGTQPGYASIGSVHPPVMLEPRGGNGGPMGGALVAGEDNVRFRDRRQEGPDVTLTAGPHYQPSAPPGSPYPRGPPSHPSTETPRAERTDDRRSAPLVYPPGGGYSDSSLSAPLLQERQQQRSGRVVNPKIEALIKTAEMVQEQEGRDGSPSARSAAGSAHGGLGRVMPTPQSAPRRPPPSPAQATRKGAPEALLPEEEPRVGDERRGIAASMEIMGRQQAQQAAAAGGGAGQGEGGSGQVRRGVQYLHTFSQTAQSKGYGLRPGVKMDIEGWSDAMHELLAALPSLIPPTNAFQSYMATALLRQKVRDARRMLDEFLKQAPLH